MLRKKSYKTKCAICDSSNNIVYIDTFNFQKNNYLFQTTLLFCRECKLRFLNPLPPKSFLENYYHNLYWRNNKNKLHLLENLIIEKLFASELNIIKKYKNTKKKGLIRIFDVGYGSGDFLHLLHNRGYDVYGIDFYNTAIDEIKEEIKNHVEVASITDEQTPFDSLAFDIIVLLHTLEHLDQPNIALRKIHKLLKPDGILIIQVPNFDCYLFKIFKYKWAGLQLPMHIFHYTPYSLRLILNKTNYQIIKIKYFSLRSNSAQWIATLFPFLEPTNLRGKVKNKFYKIFCKTLYLLFFFLFVPIALLESLTKHGNTVTIVAKKNN